MIFASSYIQTKVPKLVLVLLLVTAAEPHLEHIFFFSPNLAGTDLFPVNFPYKLYN